MSPLQHRPSQAHRTRAGGLVGEEAREIDLVLRQIRSEFEYLPGLRLTFAQAKRLFGLEAECCARMLSALLADGSLTLTPDGAYMRSGRKLRSA